VTELCRNFGISQQTFFCWLRQYDGLSPSEVQRLQQLEKENCRAAEGERFESLEAISLP